MKKRILFFVVCPLILSFMFCSKSATQSATKSGAKSETNLDTEARNFGLSLLKDNPIKCGEYWYFGYPAAGENSLGSIRQLKNTDKVNFIVYPDSLNESDKLNGLEFSGRFQISYLDEPVRDYELSTKSWGPWFNANLGKNYRIEKRNGAWSHEKEWVLKFSCADVPKSD